jgi:signal transduction histidine kinase
MKRQPFFRATKATASILPAVTAAIAFGIFIIDTVTDLEIAVDVLYVAVVLMSVSFSQKRGIIIVSAGCMALTVSSYFITPSGPSGTGTGLINDGLGLIAIGATTYLVLRIKSAELAMHTARAQLAHISRVTTLGELTVTIAHEVNQPLAAIVTNGNACLRWLARKRPNLQEARQAVERIIRNGNRASKVIKRIRDLAKKSPTQKELLHINELVREIIGLTTTEIQQSRVSLRTQLSDDLPLVLADRIQLQQVLLNLILNAIESVSSAAERSREVIVGTAEDELGDVLVTVSDSGGGLEANLLDRVFDAFYTTKPDGMGMGLTISRSIVEAHGGRICVMLNTPHGAIVQFTLPADRKVKPRSKATATDVAKKWR